MLRGFVVTALVAFGFVGSVQAGDQKASEFVLCKSAKAVRTIRVTPDAKENCTVTYSKGGVEEVVGSNRNPASCRSIVDSVRDTLENSKWNCRDVGSSVVTTSSEVSRQ